MDDKIINSYSSKPQNTAQSTSIAEQNVQTQVFDSFDELAPMQKEWDDFVESVGGEIFLTYDWCRIWWKYYGGNRNLRVFVFRDNGNLVGIIPIFFEKIRFGPVALKAVRIVGSDSTIAQFSIPLANNCIRPVIKKFYELVSEDNCDIIHIGPIAGLYDHCNELRNVLVEFFGGTHLVLIENKNVQTYFRLADSWEKYLSVLSGHERRNIKKNYKDLQGILYDRKESLTSRLAAEDNFPGFFEEFVQMHQSHWQKLGQMGHFEDWPSARAFHLELAGSQLKRGRLRLLQMRTDSCLIGYHYAYKFGGLFTHFLDAHLEPELFANINLGRICFCELTKKALQENTGWIDSLRGRYEHKRRLGGQLLPIRSVYVIRRKVSVRLRIYLFRLCARLLNLFYYRIWYCRIAPKLPFRRRPLWKLWIRTNAFA